MAWRNRSEHRANVQSVPSRGAAVSNALHYEPTRMGSHQDALASVVCFGHIPPTCFNMPVQINQWPSVPGGQNAPVLGSKQESRMAEGAKNLRVSCQGINICTLNCRSLSTEDRLLELEEELQHITWDIVGLSEVRRKGEDFLDLKSGNMFYYQGTDNGRCSGVGFLVSKNIKNNVIKATSFSDRVAMLTIKLSKRYNAEIIQVYAPTSTYEDQVIEKFYEDIVKALSQTRRHNLRIIMGDFNARIGTRHSNEQVVGAFGKGIRDERGHRLIEFAECEKFYVMNSFFKKNPKKKWTWRSPNGGTSEIDYILTDKKYTVTDCAVINRFNSGSDHRLVRCKVKFRIAAERQKMVQILKKRIQPDLLKAKNQEFQLELKNRFQLLEDTEDINEFTANFVNVVLESAENVSGLQGDKPIKKISEGTKQLMEKRRKMKYNKENNIAKVEFSELCKTLRKKIVEDTRKFNCHMIQQAIEENKSLKTAKRKLMIGRKRILALKTKNGKITRNQDHILKEAANFYSELYSSPEEIRDTSTPSNTNNIPAILKEEVAAAIKEMRKGKASGEDKLTVDILKEAGNETIEVITKLFNKCITLCDVPKDWKNAIIILLFKKGEKEDIRNYRPISLLSVLYKILMKVLTNRLQKQLDAVQPKEQAGFRSGFSTIDHIHTIREIIERSNEFELPLCMAFVDYEKAFDSVSSLAVIEALRQSNIDSGYIQLIGNIYKEATAKLKLHKTSNAFKIRKGVRQGDTISPKLFNAVLQEIFKKLNWEEKGIKIDGEFINHLRFADDIVLLASTFEELQEMLQELNKESKRVGLKMNLSKTKTMSNAFISPQKITIGMDELEAVCSYTYLGQVITMNGSIMEEINNRVKLAWRAFGRNSAIFKSGLPICLKRKVFDQCILPVLTYASETWTLTNRTVRKLQTTQRSMERCMLGFTRRDRKRNTWIREQTKVTDVICRVKKLKWNWVGHLARRNDDRWTTKVLYWIPRDKKRPRKRPQSRWRDEIVKFVGAEWRRSAENRAGWKHLGEAFILQWIDNG